MVTLNSSGQLVFTLTRHHVQGLWPSDGWFDNKTQSNLPTSPGLIKKKQGLLDGGYRCDAYIKDLEEVPTTLSLFLPTQLTWLEPCQSTMLLKRLFSILSLFCFHVKFYRMRFKKNRSKVNLT